MKRTFGSILNFYIEVCNILIDINDKKNIVNEERKEYFKLLALNNEKH